MLGKRQLHVPLLLILLPWVTLCYCQRHNTEKPRRDKTSSCLVAERDLHRLYTMANAASTHQLPLRIPARTGHPAVPAHPSYTPLSKEFLMSLTSTWEPGTLKMPCCWRPGREQRFRRDSWNCWAIPAGKNSRTQESIHQTGLDQAGTACCISLLFVFSNQGLRSGC